ncbi:MAG: cyclase family protein [Verrucomicrobia bacterium]|nr:cyclase family protein [Verrucomicrobiota bacterium]
MKHSLLEHFKIVDLTHPLTPHIPTWGGSCGFCLEVKKDYDRLFRVQQIKMHAGCGTHMDAPSHRFEGGLSIADIPVEQLIVPLCLIDVSKKANAEYEISAQDILDDEAGHGPIAQNALVIGFTGWCRFWTHPSAYRNVDAKGQMHFPAFSARSAELLMERKIAGVGIDTLSPDCLNLEFPVHKTLLSAGKYIIENIADCSQIPARGSYAIALPIRAEDATEAPIRLIALVPRGL